MRNLIIIITTVVLVFGCKSDEHPVPRVSFSVEVDLRLPDFSGEVFMLPSIFMGRRVGVSGVIVYRLAHNDYVAYDRYCTYDQSTQCVVSIGDNNFIGVCNCCDSEFLISSYDIADVISGPATIPLKKYNTRLEGQRLMIYQ